MVCASLGGIVSTSALTVAGLGLLAFFARTWAVSEIQEAVKADYQTALEELKEELRRDSHRRERATAIADLLAAWVAPNFDDEQRNNRALLDVQRKYWDLALWLDVETLRKLNDGLAWTKGADHLEALVAVRRLIVGDEVDPLQSHELIRWAPVDWSEGMFPRADEEGQPPTNQPPTNPAKS